MITLVLGGARSGKSAVAERLAAGAGEPVTYVATAMVGDDADLADRIARHRQRRPPTWATLEIARDDDLASALGSFTGTALLDALGPWVAMHMEAGEDGVAALATALATALQGRDGDVIVVSDEVGLGVHPSTDAGRRFRDLLGTVNQRVAAVADDVLLVIAGRVLRLEAP